MQDVREVLLVIHQRMAEVIEQRSSIQRLGRLR